MGQGVRERRGEPRAAIALECTLRRRTGAPVTGHTVDVGPGGMSVATARPLATDELLAFDLAPAGATPLTGRARVLRQQGHELYALRFEYLEDAERAALEWVAAGGLATGR